jgi:hypothetical protein
VLADAAAALRTNDASQGERVTSVLAARQRSIGTRADAAGRRDRPDGLHRKELNVNARLTNLSLAAQRRRTTVLVVYVVVILLAAIVFASLAEAGHIIRDG